MSKFGERLRELRKNRNVTTDQLAEVVGVTRRTLVNYESGAREPNISQIVVLANFFDVTIDYLVGRISKYHPASPRLVAEFQEKMIRIRKKYEGTKSEETEVEVALFDANTALGRFLQEIQKEFCSGDDRIQSDIGAYSGMLIFKLQIGSQSEQWVRIMPTDDPEAAMLSFRTQDSNEERVSLMEFLWPDHYDLAKDTILGILLNWYERCLKDAGQAL